MLCFLWLPSLTLYGVALLRALATQPERIIASLPISPLSRGLLLNTLFLGALTTFIAAILGAPVAWIIARGRPRVWSGFATLLCAVPLALPPALAASAWLEWTRTPPARGMASLAAQSSLPVSPIFVAAPLLAFCFFPLVVFPLAAAWRALPQEWEEAADLFGPPLQTARRVLWPLLWPALAGACGLVAAMTCWEMGAPDLLDARTYAVQIYRNISVPDAWDAGGELKSALGGLPMLLLGALTLWPALRALKFYGALGSTAPRGSTPRRAPYWVSIVALLVFAVSPIAVLAIFAWQLQGWHLALKVWGDAQREIFNTAGLATAAAISITLSAFWLVASWRSWPAKWRQGVLCLTVAPLFVAPLLQAVALIHFYNRPMFALVYGGVGPIGWEPFDTFFVFAARYGLMLIGYATRFLPLAILLLHEAIGRVDGSLLEAAASAGATPLQSARSILWPLLKPALLGVFALVWALCASELSMAVLINAPGGQTLTVPIFNWMHIASTPEVATLSLTLAAMSGGVLGVVLFLLAMRKR